MYTECTIGIKELVGDPEAQPSGLSVEKVRSASHIRASDVAARPATCNFARSFTLSRRPPAKTESNAQRCRSQMPLAFLDGSKATCPGTYGAEHPNLRLSGSFSIRKAMLLSIFAWVFRFGCSGSAIPAEGYGCS
jgi:hypothetical protein